MEIEEQERIDYERAKSLISNIFGTKLDRMEKLEQFSPVDSAFTASTATQIRRYGLEIKTTSREIYKTDGFLLKVSKYISIMEWAMDTGHEPFILYICEITKNFYIFSVADIKLDMKHLVNMNLKVTEFKETSKVLQPCIRIETKDAIIKGKIYV